MRWEAVFWDFDGVILDSVHIKTEAFAQMFHDYGDNVERAVVEFHLKHGGMSRFDKFRHYYERILAIPINDKQISRLGNEFSKLVLQKVIATPFIPGAKESLEELKSARIPCYIVTGTPEEEIKHIINKRSLTNFFEEIHGAPKYKSDIVSDIMQRKNYRSTNCLYIGDAISDYEAAMKNNLSFKGIVPHGHKSPFPEEVQTCSAVRITL